MVAALVLETNSVRSVGSSPTLPTKFMLNSYRSYDYSDNSVKVTVKDSTPQEAADFYLKHLDDFKSKIVAEGKIAVFGVESKWITFPDRYTDEMCVYTEIEINGRKRKIDFTLSYRNLEIGSMEDLRNHIQDKIVDKLTTEIRDEVLKDFFPIIIKQIEYSRKR